MEEQNKNLQNPEIEIINLENQNYTIKESNIIPSQPGRKSKKTTIILVTIWIVVAIEVLTGMLILFVKHPIENFINKIAKADSYQITSIIYDVPILGTITSKTLVAGNISYTTSLGDEEYIVNLGNTQYRYTIDDDGVWKKTEIATNEDSSDSTSNKSIVKLLDHKKYDKVTGEKNTYRQKKDVIFDDYDDVVVFVGKNSCVIEMNIILKGTRCRAKIIFSNIDEIKLTLPTVE